MTTSCARSFQALPQIDVSRLRSGDLAARQALASELGRAAREVGFFYITGHGVAAELIEGLRAAARTLFEQPMDWKMQHYIGLSLGHKGYVPEGEEWYGSGRPDRKEAFDIGYELASDHPAVRAGTPLLGHNLWPELPGFRSAVSAYYEAVFALGGQLMGAMALALGLPENSFAEWVQCPPSKLRLIHYPFDAEAEDAPGIGAHTDYECLTLLLADQPGLEVMNDAGEWIDAPPLMHAGEQAFVVNIGDMLEVMSAGAFQATAHRVRKVAQQRYSFPLFYACDYHTRIRPLPAFVERAGADALRYGELSIGEHMWGQAMQTYRYLRQRRATGALTLPEGARPTASFGPLKDHPGLF
jgi:isopenicillin N synthase-like dioxygenase